MEGCGGCSFTLILCAVIFSLFLITIMYFWDKGNEGICYLKGTFTLDHILHLISPVRKTLFANHLYYFKCSVLKLQS
ncbi:hypothetical protein XELAEV_18024199mg [Xenopus laevis]|uniref:Uncharacterized protein n=1 Tax=Xenopus laevis TaxID=8355 RepID=A0A974HL57_XENLA|nr:hypothetical protein XELAEV_18024199mg [Xenopus laevis]